MEFENIYKPKITKFIKITMLDLACNPKLKYSLNGLGSCIEQESRLEKIIKKNKLDIDKGINQLVDKLFIKYEIKRYINKIKFLINKQILDYEDSKKNIKYNNSNTNEESNNLDDLEDEENIIETHNYAIKQNNLFGGIEESDESEESEESDESDNQDDYEKEVMLKLEFFNRVIEYIGLYQIFNLSSRDKEQYEKRFFVMLDL